jgi:hypothetical protein
MRFLTYVTSQFRLRIKDIIFTFFSEFILSFLK